MNTRTSIWVQRGGLRRSKLAKGVEDAERLLEIIDKLNPLDWKKYELAEQRNMLSNIEAALGGITSVTAGLDRIILEHFVSPAHIEMEQAKDYKDALKDAKAALQKQATILQTLLRTP